MLMDSDGGSRRMLGWEWKASDHADQGCRGESVYAKREAERIRV